MLYIIHNDLDGIAPAILLKYYNWDAENILSMDYKDWDKEEILNYIYAFEKYVFIDMSPPFNVYVDMLVKEKDIVLFDHHESSLWLKGEDNFVIDINRCGTKIFLEEAIKKKHRRIEKKIEQMVELVNTYDLWKKESPLWEDANNLNRWLYRNCRFWDTGIEKYKVFIDRVLYKLNMIDEFKLLPLELREIESSIKKEHEQYNYLLKNGEKRKDKKGRTFIFCVLDSKISPVCSRYLDEHSDVDYAVIVNSYGGIQNRLSVRTAREDFNLKDEFKILHGHPKAVGGSFDDDNDVYKLISGEINELEYDEEKKMSNKKIYFSGSDIVNYIDKGVVFKQLAEDKFVINIAESYRKGGIEAIHVIKEILDFKES